MTNDRFAAKCIAFGAPAAPLWLMFTPTLRWALYMAAALMASAIVGTLWWRRIDMENDNG